MFNGISNSQQITLSTSNLMSGIYLVRLTTAQGISKTTKLMIR
ncbi:MAG: T9SS type A sorting domain-containing protein [Sphingobacteriales bacterium]|nr:T9SS type A sorting domain-containing protein [Sphingobacteriales bacterium]